MDKIYQWLIDNKEELMNKFIYNMIPNRRDAEDFYQDLFIIMSNKDDVKLNQILERTTEKNNEMMRYVYIIIKNNLKSKNSRYYYTYRKPIGIDYDEVKYEIGSLDTKDKYILLEEIENDCIKLLNDIKKYFNIELKKNPKSFYEKGIFEMYFNEKNTYRDVASILDIPVTSIYNNIQKSKDKILKVFKEDIKNINKKIYIYNTYDDN